MKNFTKIKSESGIAALAGLGGTIAAFIAASCCGIPLLLASVGVSAAWLGAIGAIGGAYRWPLLAAGSIGLALAAILLWRMQATARSGDSDCECAPAWQRMSLLASILIGAALLYLAYTNA